MGGLYVTHFFKKHWYKSKQKNMIYFKIYFTLLFVFLIIVGITFVLMVSDEERSDMWYKISLRISIALAIMVFVGALTSVWC
jgi:hypothetical protein